MNIAIYGTAINTPRTALVLLRAAVTELRHIKGSDEGTSSARSNDIRKEENTWRLCESLRNEEEEKKEEEEEEEEESATYQTRSELHHGRGYEGE